MLQTVHRLPMQRQGSCCPTAALCFADVNECELMVAVCGTALCENVEGSFLCLCPSDHEEYDTEAGQCKPRAAMGE